MNGVERKELGNKGALGAECLNVEISLERGRKEEEGLHLVFVGRVITHQRPLGRESS